MQMQSVSASWPKLKGLCHRHRYMNGWYDKAPTLSISIHIAGTKNMRLYCGQQRGTSNPVSCDIAPLNSKNHERSKSCGMIYILNIILTVHPVQSRIRTLRRAAPNQTEITDLNRSDHSTTSKEMVLWRALVCIHLTRTKDPTPRYTMV